MSTVVEVRVDGVTRKFGGCGVEVRDGRGIKVHSVEGLTPAAARIWRDGFNSVEHDGPFRASLAYPNSAAMRDASAKSRSA